jgi:hypothetical protein
MSDRPAQRMRGFGTRWWSSAPAGLRSTRSRMRCSSAANAGSPCDRGRGSGTRSSSATRPSSTSTTRSARATASCTSWVTSSAVKPCSRHSRSISCCISMRVSASSAPSGSSSSSSRGWCTSARASDTRWRCPPDRRAGQSPARSARPTCASTSRPRARCDGGRPSVTLSITRFQGKQARVLEHDAGVGAQALQRLAVEGDAAGARLVEAGHQPQQRALAAAAAADDGDELARRRPPAASRAAPRARRSASQGPPDDDVGPCRRHAVPPRIPRVPAQPPALQPAREHVGQLAQHAYSRMPTSTTSVCRNSRAFIVR